MKHQQALRGGERDVVWGWVQGFGFLDKTVGDDTELMGASFDLCCRFASSFVGTEAVALAAVPHTGSGPVDFWHCIGCNTTFEKYETVFGH